MGTWLKGIVLGTFLSGILVGSLVGQSAEAPGVEMYWSQTGLSDRELFKFIQGDLCQSSERYFLACVNALQQVAVRNELILLPGKGFQKISLEKLSELNEKDLLKPWDETIKKQGYQQTALNFEKLWKVLEKKVIDKSKLSMMVGMALNGFLSVFRDPHTYLIPIDYYKQIVASSNYKSSSYGFVITKIKQNFYIRKVIPGSPSDYVGLKRGQLVSQINGWDLRGMPLNVLNDKIRGSKDQEIQMTVQDRTGAVSHLSIRKATRELSTVHLKFQDSQSPTALLTIDRFSRGSCDKVRAALTEVRESAVRNLILDLRDNPGGQMDEAGCIAGLFVGPDKRIFSVQYLNGENRHDTYVSEEDKAYKGRTVILVNRGTASASEILAGALREYNKAILVGERTFGKGSFQEGDVWKLNHKIALFETKGFYYLPSGFSPQQVGLSPDLSVESANSGSRESGQYWNSLRLSHKESEPLLGGLPFETCQSMDLTVNHADDPEMIKAQQALSCWGVAQVSGAWR